jgi:hypothetical protein
MVLFRFSGKDLITGVSCTEPYEWSDRTSEDWEFSSQVPHGDFEPFRVGLKTEFEPRNLEI